MTPASQLTAQIAAAHPAASRCLSALGQRLFFPRGIPAQARDAVGCAVDATIGQLTDGRGHAVALPCLREQVVGLDPEAAFLYAPQGGYPALRRAWYHRITKRAPTVCAEPIVTCGLTHGLSIVADLFAGPHSDVLLPSPGWGNYNHIFGTRRGARLRTYPLIEGDGLALDAIRAAVAACDRPTVMVVNVPSNPVGYTPTRAEGDALLEVLSSAPVPMVVVMDDAYGGMGWEPGLMPHSLFHELSHVAPDRLLAVKVDGVTKELFFFGGRVGFLTWGCTGAAADALTDKALGSIRSTISTSPSPSQAMVLASLRDPGLEDQRREILEQLRSRYHLLKAGLREAGLPTWPFNSAFFSLVHVQRDAELVRQALLADSIGVVSVPAVGAVRLSYGSVAVEDIPRLVSTLARHAR